MAHPAALAALGRLDAGLAQRVQHELDILHATADSVVHHFQGGLVIAGIFAGVGALAVGTATVAGIQTLLLLCCIDLFLQIVTLITNSGVKKNSVADHSLTYIVLLELIEVVYHVTHCQIELILQVFLLIPRH